ncbi:carboxypeptidase-like regulatory domain-containing protein [Geofilum rubicundum]|nr:carboxypeptidase-like regulatory domain-containing protein [Geofilum rubicundum]
MKRKIILISLIGLLFSSVKNFSQVRSIVVDRETNQPISMVAVTVQGKSKGTYTNEIGLFAFSEIGDTDSIQFKHIGFDKNIISNQDLKDTIRLSPRINYLNEIIVSPSKYSLKKSKNRNKNSNISFAGFSGLELTQLIKMEAYNDYIKSVKIFTKKALTKDSTYIRLHLYANKNGKPGTEILLNRGIIISSNVDKYILFNLEFENVVMPKEGLFVGIEWINQIINQKQQLEPRVLLSKSKRQDQITYYRFWDNDWESLNTLLRIERANTIIELTGILKEPK